MYQSYTFPDKSYKSQKRSARKVGSTLLTACTAIGLSFGLIMLVVHLIFGLTSIAGIPTRSHNLTRKFLNWTKLTFNRRGGPQVQHQLVYQPQREPQREPQRGPQREPQYAHTRPDGTVFMAYSKKNCTTTTKVPVVPITKVPVVPITKVPVVPITKVTTTSPPLTVRNSVLLYPHPVSYVRANRYLKVHFPLYRPAAYKRNLTLSYLTCKASPPLRTPNVIYFHLEFKSPQPAPKYIRLFSLKKGLINLVIYRNHLFLNYYAFNAPLQRSNNNLYLIITPNMVKVILNYKTFEIDENYKDIMKVTDMNFGSKTRSGPRSTFKGLIQRYVSGYKLFNYKVFDWQCYS